MNPSRRGIPEEVQKEVLVASRRRCCLCYFIKDIKTDRPGQIAHLSGDPSRISFDDLVYLCLEHHDEFDSTTSQTKGLTAAEVRHHRDELYKLLAHSAESSPVAPTVDTSEGEAPELAGGVRLKRPLLDTSAGWSEERDRPHFGVTRPGAGTLEGKFSPEFKVEQFSGDLVANFQWRIRGPRFSMEWRQAAGSRLADTKFVNTFDLTTPAQKDDIVELDQMGFEIRFYWRGQWRSQLHRWPITRRVLPNKVLWDIGDELLPPLETDQRNTHSTARGAEQRARLLESQQDLPGEVQLRITPDRSFWRSPIFRETAVLRIATVATHPGIKGCYAHVLEVLWDEQGEFSATLDSQGEIIDIDENSHIPIFVPIWGNHDIYLRWTGLPTSERYHGFPTNAVLEVAVDTWEQGTETAFFAVANEQAETEYVLHPNHRYLVTVEIGADNVKPVTKRYRLALVQSHLKSGLLNRGRLEMEEIDRVPLPP